MIQPKEVFVENDGLSNQRTIWLLKRLKNFFETIQLDRYLWDIIRNTVKYGDCFTELILDINKPQEGLKKIKILNPNFILRVENEYGYLKQFLQEIPYMDTFNYGAASETSKPVKYVELDKNHDCPL